MSTQLTAKNHGKQLLALGASLAATHNRIQDFIVFGIEHYTNPENKSNASYLTDLIEQLNTVKSSTAKAVQKYIEAHTNTKFTLKDKVAAFRKVGKKAPATSEPLTVTWFDFGANNANKAVPEIGVVSTINSLADRITTGLADNKAFKAFTEKDLKEAMIHLGKAMKDLTLEMKDDDDKKLLAQ